MNLKLAKAYLEDALDELLMLAGDNVNVQLPLKKIAGVIEMINAELHKLHHQ
jgi:hypothetical protein